MGGQSSTVKPTPLEIEDSNPNFKNILNLPYDPIYYSFIFISLIPPFFVSKSPAGRLFKNKKTQK